MRHTYKALFGLAAIAGGAFMASTPAQASAPTPKRIVAQQEMQRLSPVNIGAIKGGKAAVTLSNGAVISVDASAVKYLEKALPKPGRFSPLNTVYGNCGESFVYESGMGNSAIDLYTGFVLSDFPAVDYSWHVRLDDRGGSSTKSWGGGLAERFSWSWEGGVYKLTKGGAAAYVLKGSSYAVDTTGGVCYSAGPSDTTTIT